MQISDEFYTILAYAREEAMRTGSYVITPDHLFLGILRHSSNEACDIITGHGADLSELKTAIDACIRHERSIPYHEELQILLNRDSSNALSLAVFEATREKSSSAGSRHLLKALCHTDGYKFRHLLDEAGIVYDEVKPVPQKKEEDEKSATKTKMTRILGSISIKAPDIYS